MELPDPLWRQELRRRITRWFAKHARTLPWRESSDPYRIWLSEIMLQQTQVETVRSYFERFVRRFPDIQQLASADEHEVLLQWEGLGYYRRARQLHLAAKIIAKEYQGEFPNDFEAILALPGVGRYTAGAIASIAFDQRRPIVEANTIRLYSRLLAYREDPRTASGQRVLWRFAEEILPRRHVGRFNQALMELGAIVCLPSAPRCEVCPVAAICPTRGQGLQQEIPAPAKKTRYTEVNEIAVVVQRRGRVLLRQCEEGERWAGLFDFPRFERSATKATVSFAARQVRSITGIEIDLGDKLTTIRHGVTRFRITLDCYAAKAIGGRLRSNANCQWSSIRRLDQFPLSVTGRKIAKLLAENQKELT